MQSEQPTGVPVRATVIIPAYNESETIGQTVSSIRALEEKMYELGCRLQVIVIDDGSTDSTGECAAAAGATRVIRHHCNLGLGAAVRSGMLAARNDGSDIVVKFDGDGQHLADDIPTVIRPILANEADLVYGNRFPSIAYRMPWLRRIGNIAFTRLMRHLTGWPLEDSQPGIFAAARTYLEIFHLPGDYNYTQQVLLDAYHKNMRFAQVPVHFRQRMHGDSFVSLRYPFHVLPQIILVLVSVKPLRVFAPLGLTLFGAGALLFGVELYLNLTGRSTILHDATISLLLIFGMQTLFFGLLAEVIVRFHRKT